MGFFRRLKLFWQSHFSSRLGVSAASLDRVYAQVDAQLTEARDQLALCQAEERRLQSLMAEEQHAAERMLAHAREALTQSREELAREAAARHLQALRQAVRYRTMWEQQRADIKRFQSLVEILDGKRTEVEYQRQRVNTRQQLARSRKALLHTLYSEQGHGLVEQADEAALTEEYTTDAYQQILSEQSLQPLDFTTEASADPVEAILAQLRRELPPPAP